MALFLNEGNAKVENFAVAVLQQHDIFWLDIAMDYPTFMRIGEGIQDLNQHAQHLIYRQQLGCVFLHYRPQCLSPHVFKHQVLRAPLLSVVQVALDVGMTEEPADLCLTLVARKDSRATNHIIIGKLEHDLLQRMPVLGEVDMARASSSKRTDDLVVINSLTRLIDSWHTSSLFFYCLLYSGGNRGRSSRLISAPTPDNVD